MARPILIPLLLFIGVSASGQSGIRVTLLDFESVTKKFSPNFLLGFDRDLTDRTSFGIDLLKSYSFNSEGINDEILSGTTSTYYSQITNSWGMQYRSQYFFSGSGYIATSVGFRSIAIQIKGTTTNYSSSYTTNAYYSFNRSVSTTTFPIGLRLGFRSDLDGYYGDIYAGIGYNAGGKADLGTDALMNTDVLSNLWINIGYALGIGW